jgi:hypothetical protein
MYSCLADILERLLLDDPTESIDGMPPRRQSPPVPASSAEPASLTPTSTASASSAPSQEEGAAVTHAQLRQYHESQINPNLTSVHNQFRQFSDQGYELIGRLNSQAQDIQRITSQYTGLSAETRQDYQTLANQLAQVRTEISATSLDFNNQQRLPEQQGQYLTDLRKQSADQGHQLRSMHDRLDQITSMISRLQTPVPQPPFHQPPYQYQSEPRRTYSQVAGSEFMVPLFSLPGPSDPGPNVPVTSIQPMDTTEGGGGPLRIRESTRARSGPYQVGSMTLPTPNIPSPDLPHQLLPSACLIHQYQLLPLVRLVH